MKKIFLICGCLLSWVNSSYTQDLIHCTDPYIPFNSTLRSALMPVITKIKDKALVVTYPSVFDVHSKPDTVKYPNIRIQPTGFDANRVLEDIRASVKADQIDFVLFFFLQEVPGWINSGPRYQLAAQNIGLSGNQTKPNGWTRLKSIPHMNDVAFLDRPTKELPNYGSTLTVFHEIGHYTCVYFCQQSQGPRDWNPSQPLAHLAAASSHWSWNFNIIDKIVWPGIMYSGATTDRFNAFDLYAMGLMHYDEAIKYEYLIYEDPNVTKTHKLNVDDLIFSLKTAGAPLYVAPGKRIPATDPAFTRLNSLSVIVRGQDEIITSKDSALISKLVDEIPRDWVKATWGRSSMASTIALDNAIIPTTSLTLQSIDPDIKIFSNTNTDKINIDIPKEGTGYRYSLYALDGRKLKTNILFHGVNEISYPSGENGIIVVTVVKNNVLVGIKKVIS